MEEVPAGGVDGSSLQKTDKAKPKPKAKAKQTNHVLPKNVETF